MSRFQPTNLRSLGTQFQIPITPGKRILDDEKVDRWAEQLIKGEAYLGQLSWNLPLANS